MRISDWSSDVCSSDLAMTPFEFSARTLDELERVQGRRGTGRGRVDRRGNRNAERALGAMLRAPHELVFGGVGRASDAVASRPSLRSEERRVGKEWVSTCKSRWSPDLSKKKKYK